MGPESRDLIRLDVVGPLLAESTGDERWLDAQATLIVGGKSNLTYELTCQAGSLILRRPPDGSVLATAHDMGREARIQQALAETAVPVAEIVLVDDGAAIGVPFYVMEKVPGQVVRDRLPDAFANDPNSRHALGDALVDVLADLHGIEPSGVGLVDYGRPDGFVQRQGEPLVAATGGKQDHRHSSDRRPRRQTSEDGAHQPACEHRARRLQARQLHRRP